MKHFFTLLFVLSFIPTVFSQSVVVTVTDSDDNSLTVSGNTVNVLAGQVLFVKVTISEPNITGGDSYFKAGPANKLYLLGPGPKTFIDNNQTDIGYSASKFDGTASEDITATTPFIYDPVIVKLGTVTDTIKQKINVATEGNSRDKIIIDSVKITIPTNVTEAGVYQLQLIHDFIKNLASPYTFLTFKYQTPVLQVVKPTTKGCINTSVSCNVSVTSPLGCKYILYVNGEQGEGEDTIQITNTPRSIDFNYRDVVTVRDSVYLSGSRPPTDGKSNAFSIDTSYFLPLMLGMSTDTVCAGTDITFSLLNAACFNEYTLKAYFNNVFLTDVTVGSSFIYAPQENGDLIVKAFKGTSTTPIAVSNVLTLTNILVLSDSYDLDQGIRLPESQGTIILMNKLKPGFVWNNSQMIDIEGIYGGGKGSLRYFTNNYAPNSDFTFGRFHIAYNDDDDDYSLDTSVFDTNHDGVTTGYSNPNNVKFHYGKYFHTAKKYCYESTETNITVIKSNIFVPKESFCSYDENDYEIEINYSTPDFQVSPGYTYTSSYSGYKLESPRGTTSGTTNSFNFRPSNQTDGSSISTIKVSANAKIKIYKLATPCYPEWSSTHGAPRPIYFVGDEVSYLNKEYRCNADALATDIPGISGKWTFVRNCLLIKPDLPPDLPPDLEPVSIDPKNPDLQLKCEAETNMLKSSEEMDVEVSQVPDFVPIGEYNCLFDSWNSYGHPLPIYNAGETVTYGGKNYKANRGAYPDDVPGISSAWTYLSLCNSTGDPVEVNYVYATETFYIYKPREDGEILNLDIKYCPSKDSILLVSNYIIDNITGRGISSKLISDDYKVYYYSYGKAYKTGQPKDTIILSYTDNNGCSEVDSSFTTIDPEYLVDKKGEIYWAKDGQLNPLDTNYCLNSYKYQLATTNSYTIDSIVGIGVSKNDDDIYFFNPSGVTGNPDTTIYLYYTDNVTACPYYYDHPIHLSADHVDSSSALLFLEDKYCAVDKDFEIKTSEKTHLIDSITGKGIEGNNINSLNYNPFRALNLDGNSAENIYNGAMVNDTIRVYFYDTKNCRYQKSYPVAVSGTYGDTSGELLNLESAYCKYDNQVQLIGSHEIDSIVSPGVDSTEGNKWILYPDHSDFIDSSFNQTVHLTYYYKDVNKCVWSRDYQFDMNARPKPGFDFSGICYGDYTAFVDTSVSGSGANVTFWEWDFGNGLKLTNPIGETQIPDGTHSGQTRGTYSNPEHKYKDSGVYPVSMKLVTDKGCANSVIDTVIIGDYPKVAFSFEDLIENDPTHFTNLTTNPDYDPVVKYIWSFDDPLALNDTFEDTLTQPKEYTFDGIGVHQVNLEAISRNNCISDTTALIPIFPYIVVNNNSNYVESFNNQQTGWLSAFEYRPDLPSGWKYISVQPPFNKYPNTNGSMWLTGDPADQVANEKSWLESPCFDISGLDFPLLTMDIFQSVEKGRDGAVVQYSLDDGNTWTLISNGADLGGGINWYNQSGIVSNPGNQVGTGNMGWSLNNKEWQTARFPLDQVKSEAINSGAKCIRFRVAYSSDAGNAQSENVNGFAFDNFILSGRTRVVMLEQFVNTANNKSLQESEEAWLDEFTKNNQVEVVDMRYHNYISHDKDPIYDVNPPDISARSMEYGANMSQLTMVDGIYRCIAPAETEAMSKYNIRTLTDKRFDIQVTTKLEGGNLHISADITKLTDTLTSIAGSQKSVVRMAIVQKEYKSEGETFKNVVVELLPNGEGNVVASIPADLPKGETVHAEGNWKPEVTTVGNDFRLVVYVQGIWGVDEIHQVWFSDLDQSQVPQLTVKASEKELVSKSSFNVYPSPVKEQLNIIWSEPLESAVNWKLVSMSGSVVKQGTTPAGQVKEGVDTYELQGGIYLLITENPANSEVEKRKILILK